MIPRAIVATALVLLACVPASAQSRTDVVTLSNGDRITGEIMSLSRGRLELKTDDAGTIDIEWDNIAGVQSTRQFEVEMSDGRRLLGSLESAADRNLVLVAVDGRTPLPVHDITRITPIGSSFWAKLEGGVDAGFSYTRSSGIAQINLHGDVLFRRPAFLFRLSGSATLTKQEDGDHQDDRAAIGLSYARYRGRNWFVAGMTSFESNQSLGLELRSQIGSLIGWRLVNTNRSQVGFGAGLVGNDEQGVDSEATQNLEGLISFSASYYSYDGPKTGFDSNVQ